jgi:hypothetical protein
VYNHYSIKQTNLLSPYLHISHRDKKKQMHFKTLLPEKKYIYIYKPPYPHRNRRTQKQEKKIFQFQPRPEENILLFQLLTKTTIQEKTNSHSNSTKTN